MLTLETLTQADLQLAYAIWYKFSGTTLPRRPVPRVAVVEREFETVGDFEVVLGMGGCPCGKLRIKKTCHGFSPGYTPIYFSAKQRDEDEDAGTRRRNREIARAIEEAWKAAGLQTRFG